MEAHSNCLPKTQSDRGRGAGLSGQNCTTTPAPEFENHTTSNEIQRSKRAYLVGAFARSFVFLFWGTSGAGVVVQ
eukprot:5722624-Amphidinium_carterae.1